MATPESLNSDESNSSITSTIARDSLVARQFVEAAKLELLPGSTILERSLNIKSVISTTSSFAQRFQSAKTRPDLQDINQIGIGLQGVILEQIGKTFVLKKELSATSLDTQISVMNTYYISPSGLRLNATKTH